MCSHRRGILHSGERPCECKMCPTQLLRGLISLRLVHLDWDTCCSGSLVTVVNEVFHTRVCLGLMRTHTQSIHACQLRLLWRYAV